MEGKKFRAGKKSTARAPPHSPQSVSAGNVVFRILCLESQVGAVIGKYGSVIKQLQKSTKSKIRVEDAATDSPYRVITITAQGGSTSRVKLGVKNGSNREKEEQEEEVEVSIAQEALIRVFEVLNVKSGTSTVFCRLLTEGRYSSALILNRSKIVEKTGCKIEIRIGDLPIRADPDDAMIEIQGNVLAVKKAIVSISSFYGKEMLASKSLEALPRPVEMNSQDYSFSHGTSLRSSDVNSQMDPFDSSHKHYEIVQEDPSELSSPNPYDYVLKILCASCVIGFVIRDLQSDHTAVSISVGNALADCDERLITMTTIHNAEYIVRACKLLGTIPTEKVPESEGGYCLISPARLVVSTNQIGCLLGKGGSKISEMVEKREVSIQILDVEQNPKCISEKHRVVQISGGRSSSDVEDAIELVIRRLRDDLLLEEDAYYTIPEEPFPNRFNDLLDNIYNHSSQAPSWLWASPTFSAPRGVYDGTGCLSSTKDDRGIDRHKSSNVTNTTVDIRVPENVVNFVCGYGENCYDHLEGLRQMTGAKVIVQEPRLGARDRIITIFGTPDQTQGAEKLLRSFISYGESISSLKRTLL